MFQAGSTHRSDGIGTQVFYAEVLGNSHHKPYLLNFYTDFCMQCADVEIIWKAMHTVSSLSVSIRSYCIFSFCLLYWLYMIVIPCKKYSSLKGELSVSMWRHWLMYMYIPPTNMPLTVLSLSHRTSLPRGWALVVCTLDYTPRLFNTVVWVMYPPLWVWSLVEFIATTASWETRTPSSASLITSYLSISSLWWVLKGRLFQKTNLPNYIVLVPSVYMWKLLSTIR